MFKPIVARPAFGREAYVLADDVPAVADPYQKFFNEIKDLGVRRLSDDARNTLRLSTEELQSLVAITTDLATASRANPSEPQWAQAITDHVEQLKAAFGEQRSQILDDWVRSGKSMFEK